MTYQLPNGKQQFLDNNGNPLVGGKVYNYFVNTSNPKDTYQDAALTIPNSNPIILDGRGQATIYGSGDSRQVLKDASDVLIWDQVVVDPGGASSAQISNFIADLGNNSDPAKGASLVGYSTGTVYGRLHQELSIEDFGARTTNSDNLSQINAAIAACARGQKLLVPDGRIYPVSAAPSNAKGVEFIGNGKILSPWPVSQINTYRYSKPFGINREYLFVPWNVIKQTNSAVRIYTYGDSTVEGGFGYIDWPFFLQVLLPSMWAAKGIRNALQVTNRGVGGTAITAWNPIPDLALPDRPNMIFVKYGLNDPYAANALQTYETALRSKLAEIRANVNGTIDELAIVIVAPNAAWDEQGDFRNTKWFESLRSVHEAAAHDYKCAFVDPYMYLQDASMAANRWLDKPFADNSALHPTNIGQAWIWGGIFDWLFKDSETLPWRANAFLNKSEYFGWPRADFTFYPSNYTDGITVEIAQVSDGWPRNGMLYTLRNPNGQVHQRLTPTGTVGPTLVRNGDTVGNFFGAWRGVAVALTLSNGWTPFGGSYQYPGAVMDEMDRVMLTGLIRPGTTTAGTVLFTLIDIYRPATQRIVRTGSDTGTVELEFMPNGNVLLRSGSATNYVTLDGVAFSR